jgi:hypothetical protein
MWTYQISTGELNNPDLPKPYIGYSGQPPSLNNPNNVAIHNQGPIPSGLWVGAELFRTGHHCGPFTITLLSMPGTETYGRDGIMMHGGFASGAMTASHGCIVQGLEARVSFWNSDSHLLNVIP